MLTLELREKTTADQLQAALAAQAAAVAAELDAATYLDTVRPSPDADDPLAAARDSVKAKADARRTLDRARATREEADALVESLDGLAHQQRLARRKAEAVRVLQSQQDAEAEMQACEARERELAREREALQQRRDNGLARIASLASRLHELQQDGRERLEHVAFNNLTRAAVPAKHPMRLQEWRRLWDARLAAGIESCAVTVDRPTGWIVAAHHLPDFPILAPASIPRPNRG
jgi:hypothetical protein